MTGAAEEYALLPIYQGLSLPHYFPMMKIKNIFPKIVIIHYQKLF
jgi:hypothetical protein